MLKNLLGMKMGPRIFLISNSNLPQMNKKTDWRLFPFGFFYVEIEFITIYII
jgi:hypothetical protein